ncbi:MULTISPECIES: flagellar protein FlgN [unclassified Devosia]|uniref:flagellar protein FlgN n=1 Tax=unclassified Devosia TaxID=196773 RepID=UPI000FD799AE|nr:MULTISPECIES: flagellar protein FlgN [unclassified Devosia]
MTAAARLAARDALSAHELCRNAEAALTALVDVMNQETTLLRAGRLRDAGTLTADKARLAQDYVEFARSIQRENLRLKAEAPDALDRLRLGHEQLATQMAENLRVLATARTVTEDLLSDVATVVGKQNRAQTYGRAGTLATDPAHAARGIAVNRAL